MAPANLSPYRELRAANCEPVTLSRTVAPANLSPCRELRAANCEPVTLSNLAALALVALLWLTHPLSAQVVISEFLASNQNGLRDDDGARSDWIELHNPSPNAVNVDGWFLTDDRTDLAQWRFPATHLPPDGRLVVFASGKNRASPGAPLHTNFRLDTDGGYLALVHPDGSTLATHFDYPRQFPDVSFGPGFGPARNPTYLVGPNPPCKYLIPAADPDPAWRGGAPFHDQIWSAGALPAGFDLAESPPTTAVVIPANTPGNQAFGGSLGLDVNLRQPIQLTALGCFDDLADGLAPGATVTVTLWRRDDRGTPGHPFDDVGLEVLARTNFTSAAPGSLVGGQRFKTLPTPLELSPGAYSIVASGYGTAERNGNAAADGFPQPAVQTAGGALEFVRSRWGEASQFPTVVDVLTTQYGAGTFQFHTRPQNAFPTSLATMHPTHPSALVRIPFIAPSPPSRHRLSLRIRYDDGFVAWLNGVEIARRHAPSQLTHQSTATATATWSSAETIDVTPHAIALRPGPNLLALHLLNAAPEDPDLALDLTLAADGTQPALVYFEPPTAGDPNPDGLLFPNVVIHELHIDPPQSKSIPAEFIELFNPRPTPVDLSGWSFTRGIHFTFPPGASLAPGGFLVVAENPAAIRQVFGVDALGPWNGSLDNTGEPVELARASGSLVDRVRYGVGFPWPTVGDDPAASLQLIHEGLDHELGGSWRSAPPTPGAPNAVAAANAPPAIRQVTHSPAQPTSHQPVLVTAKITDPDAVQDVSLEYCLVAPGTYVRLSDPAYHDAWTPQPMRDDGQNGDAVAGDAIYSALVPASVQTHRRLIRYRIAARDGAGHAVRVPYPDDPCPNFAWFVHDGLPAWTGAVQPGVTAPATFSPAILGHVRPFHLLARPDDVQNCQYNPAYNETLYRFEGTLVADGTVHDHVRFRIAGQNSTYVTGKNKWKFRFPRGHELALTDDRGQPTGAARRTLKVSGLAEPWAAWNRGLAGLDEAVANRLYNLAGVPAPRTLYFQLRIIDHAAEASSVNQYDGDLWGLYLGFEEYDESFKDSHGLPDGNLFLLQTGNHRLGAQGAGQPADFTDLHAFLSGTLASPLPPLSWWRTNVHLPTYYSWRAVTEAINNTDIRHGENVACFRNPTNGLWSIHPWDSDLLYEQFDRWGPEGVQSRSPYEQIRRCLEYPTLNVEFQNRARELRDLLLNHDQIGKLVDEFVSLLTPHGPSQPGFVEVDRRLWDWHPRTATDGRSPWEKGNFYRSPFPVPPMPYGPYNYSRILASPDFAGQVDWVKRFIVDDPHGGARLAALAHDPTIPFTPSLAYLGPPGYPPDAMFLASSEFASPVRRAFAAIQWRLAEICDPTVPSYVPGAPNRYEVQASWDSGPLPTLTRQITVPAATLQTGHTYRARVRHLDDGGRWSHWSAPLTFTAGADQPPVNTPPRIELRLHPALVIHGQIGTRYRVEVREDPDGPWQPLLEIPALPASPWTVYDPHPAGTPRRSYRVLLLP